jgi:hypothetical protein
MAYFAKVSKGVVVNVIKCEPDIIGTIKDTSAGKWIQTSYNTRGGVHYDPKTGQRSADQSKALRKNYAGVGYSYDSERDAFIPPQPFPSWTLNDATCLWEPPVAMPTDGKMYSWDEDSGSWKEAEAA